MKKSKKRIRLIIILAVSVILLAIAFVVGKLVIDHNRREHIKELLAGNRYEYSDFGYSTYSHKSYTFDDAANCTYYAEYYFADNDHEFEYSEDYEIVFKNGKVFLKFEFGDTLEVRFDSYGDIDCLYDLTFEEEYD